MLQFPFKKKNLILINIFFPSKILKLENLQKKNFKIVKNQEEKDSDLQKLNYFLLKFSFHTICASFKNPNVASRTFSKSSIDDNFNSSNLSAANVVIGLIKSKLIDGNEISGSLNHEGNESSGQLNEKLGNLNQLGSENSGSEKVNHSGHERVGNEGNENSGSENFNHSGHANAGRAGNTSQAGQFNKKLGSVI